MLKSIQNSPDYLFFKNLDIKSKIKYILYLIRKKINKLVNIYVIRKLKKYYH